MTYSEAISIAMEPESRFSFGSPCRYVPPLDFVVHLLVPEVLRKGDTSQQSLWDRSRTLLASRLRHTSPRWKRIEWADR